MIVRQLDLQAFGGFQQEAFAFAPGMNLISGPNESGKSTLLEAIPAVLFGVRDAQRFVPWGARDCRAALVLEASGRTVRIERDLLTDRVEWSEQDADGFQLCFSGHVGSDGPVAKRADYHRRLQQLLCPAEEGVLRAAFWFGPYDPDGSGRDRLLAVLRKTLAGADGIDYHQALEALQQDYLAITRDNPWGLEAPGEGQLEAIGRQLESLEKRWFAARQSHRELTALEQRMAQPQSEPDDPAGEARPLHVPAAGEEGASVREDPPEAPAKQAEPDSPAGSGSPPAEIAGRRQELEAELAKTGLPRDIPVELPDLLAAAADSRQKLAELQRQLSAQGEALRRHGPPPWRLMAIALAVFWAAFVGCGLARGWSGFLGLGGLLATAAAAGWQGRRWWRRRTARQRIEEQIGALEREQEQAREQRTSLDERFEQCGFAVSAVEMVRMQRNLSRHGRLREELRRLDEAEETAAPDSGEETMAVPLSTDGEEAARPRPAGLDELNVRRAELRRELAACRQIEVEGDCLRALEAQLLRRRDVLGTACELLHSAIGEHGGFHLDRFAVAVGEHLEQLTAGRYDEVRLTADFDIQLGGPDGRWQPLARCGGAIRHVAQLAVRLALGQYLAEAGGPPLLLDDVLTMLDKKRRGPVLQTLEQLSAGQQVVLCSHDEALRRRAGRYGWQVVTLGMTRGKAADSGKERNGDDGQLSLL